MKGLPAFAAEITAFSDKHGEFAKINTEATSTSACAQLRRTQAHVLPAAV